MLAQSTPSMEILALYYFSFLVAILIHELGHLISVLIVGHKVIEFSVGPICIKWLENKYIIRPRKWIFTGLVSYERKLYKTTWGKEVLIISGGILANILIGLSFIFYYCLISDDGFIIILGWVSLILGFINFIPTHIKNLGLDSDAKRFLTMLAFKKAISKNRKYDLKKPLIDVSLQSKDRDNPNKVQIEFLNDDITRMDFVVDIFKTYLNLDDYGSAVIMLDIHNNGSVKVGWFEAEEAKKLTEQIEIEAMKHGFPFQCNVSIPLNKTIQVA